MSDESSTAVDLFALGQQYFDAFIKEFASYGLEADEGIELRKGKGVLCYYSLKDRHIYLAVPDLNDPVGNLQAYIFRTWLGCDTDEELIRFFELFIPHIIAHELAHHYRHRRGLFDKNNLWNEEQVANKLAVAVRKHRLSPQEKEYAKNLLRRAIDHLGKEIEEKNIATDSYYSVLHALNVSGKMGVADFEKAELVQTMLNVSSEEILVGSGQLSDDFLNRLDNRDEIIQDVNQEYATDQIKYIYYHLGWLSLDLSSRETEYVGEFARNYLNLGVDLLPEIDPDETSSSEAVQASYKAYLDTQPLSTVAGRFFYKRYRALLLTRLKDVHLNVDAQTERLKREAALVLEEWSEAESDTLNYVVQLAPAELQPLFPHLIADNLDPQLVTVDHLPSETDRRLWQQVTAQGQSNDEAAVNTLHRLMLLDQTDIYRSLPAELLLKLTHLLNQVHFAAQEPVIWQGERNDDVYFLIEGKLEVLVDKNGSPEHVVFITPGQMFGEIAFFTEHPRYATVRAVEPSRCFVLTDADLQLVAYQHPPILMRMAGALATRLATTYQTSRNETV